MTAQTDTADQLHSYFEKSIAIVRGAVERVDYAYAKPALEYVLTSFQTRPITTTFLSVFLALSSGPIGLFTVFSLYASAACVTIALIAALFASSLVILAAAGVLACILLVLLFVALSATAGIVATFLTLRLLILVRVSGVRGGVSQWGQETKARIRKDQAAAPAVQNAAQFESFKPEHDEDKSYDASDEQSVVSESASTVVAEIRGVPGEDFKDDLKIEPKED